MTEREQAEIMAAAMKEAEDSKPWRASIELDGDEMVDLAMALQVLVRHPVAVEQGPDFTDTVRQFIERVRDLVPEDRPALRRLMDLGFHSPFEEKFPKPGLN